MAHTIKDDRGNSVTASPTGSSGVAYVIGPPTTGAPNQQGRFIRESGSGASTVYRWIADEPIIGAAPTSYRFTTAG